MKNYFQHEQYRSVHQIAFINEHPIHSALTTRIKGEVEKAWKRAIADGVGAEGGVYPLRFCNSYVCCAQIIPLGPFAVSPLQTFDRTRKPQSRKNSFASEPVRKTHVTESGDEIPMGERALRRPTSRILRFRSDKSYSCFPLYAKIHSTLFFFYSPYANLNIIKIYRMI